MIRGWWKRRQRRFDQLVLWPMFVEQASARSLVTVEAAQEFARGAFRLHTEIDPAYSDLTPAEVDRFVADLPWRTA